MGGTLVKVGYAWKACAARKSYHGTCVVHRVYKAGVCVDYRELAGKAGAN